MNLLFDALVNVMDFIGEDLLFLIMAGGMVIGFVRMILPDGTTPSSREWDDGPGGF